MTKVLVYDTYRGQVRVRAWPRPRHYKEGSAAKLQSEWFRSAQELAKRLTPDQQRILLEATNGTPLLPRDVAAMLMAGRLFYIHNPETGNIYPMAARQDVSESLDILASTPGQILIRGADFWEGTTPSFGGGGWFWNEPPGVVRTDTSTSSYCFKGGQYDIFDDILVSGCGAIFTPVGGGSYQMIIGELNESDEFVSLTKSSVVEAPDSERRPYFFDIDATLNAGTRVAIMAGRIDSTATYALPAAFNRQLSFQLPVGGPYSARIASTDPMIGDAINTTGGVNVIPMGLFGQIT